MHGFLLNTGEFTTIDYPDAQFTIAYGISPAGDIIGIEADQSGTVHGFLLRNGKFRAINYPGASATLPTMMIGDRIVGGNFDAAGVHGFLRYRGHFQGIDCPGYTNLFLSGLNPTLELTGGFNSADGVVHAYLLR